MSLAMTIIEKVNQIEWDAANAVAMVKEKKFSEAAIHLRSVARQCDDLNYEQQEWLADKTVVKQQKVDKS